MIQIYSWNVNGIREILARDDLRKFIKKGTDLQTCDLRIENPAILCFNEAKIDEDRLSKEKIRDEFKDDYPFQFWNCSKPPKLGYSGCTILSKFKPLDVKFDLGVPKHDQEGRTLALEYDKFVLVAVYVPNSGQMLKRIDYRIHQWDPDFRTYLTGLSESKKKPVILCGDLNCAHKEIDMAKPKANLRSPGFTVEERAEFDRLLGLGFVDTFRALHPGQVRANSGLGVGEIQLLQHEEQREGG